MIIQLIPIPLNIISRSANDVFKPYARVRGGNKPSSISSGSNDSPSGDLCGDIANGVSWSAGSRRHRKSRSGVVAHRRSGTRAELNVWKDKYAELKISATERAKEIAYKDIELEALQDKIIHLQEIIEEDNNCIERLQQDLDISHQSYLRMYQQEVVLKKQHQRELIELKKLLNDAKDETATLLAENERLKEWKRNFEKEQRKKEKLHTKQLKFNEELMNEIFDLNNEVKQLTDINIEMKSKFEGLIVETSTTMDEYKTNKNKLRNAKKTLKEEKQQNTRLKNKVRSLNNEVMGLNETISNLENLFSEHSHLLRSKNRRIKHLGKQTQEQEQNISRLNSKLKKQNRHIKGFLEAEEESFKKSYSAKDKRLDMLRERNMKLVSTVEENDKKIIELQVLIKDTKIKLKDEITTHRMDNKKLKLEISKLKADNHRIISSIQEIQYERDEFLKKNNELLNEIKSEKSQNKKLISGIKDTINSINYIENKYLDILTFLDSMDMKEDNLYKFVDRCRNTFINTDKLTNKLIAQLIEGCDRAICVYHNSVSHFKQLIDNCIDIKKDFKILINHIIHYIFILMNYINLHYVQFII